MIASLIVSILPYPIDDTVIAILSSIPLVTGISHLIAGFAQATLHQIAYFQQSIVLWLAGMCVGPAAIAWLRRTHGQTNALMFLLTVIYVLCMGAFFSITVHNSFDIQSGEIYNCFLGEVPAFYGEKSMKIINSFMVGLTVIFVLVSAITNCVYKKNRSGRYLGFFARQPKVSTKWEWFLVSLVFVFELMIAILAFKTGQQFGQNVDPTTSTSNMWTFGQIVPLVMVILPVIACLKAIFAGEAINTAQAAISNINGRDIELY
jgi:hypothetical protein